MRSFAARSRDPWIPRASEARRGGQTEAARRRIGRAERRGGERAGGVVALCPVGP
ncbi:hypothetical protein WMF20_16225 [Sorangium sp. So ce834]|uniref:hypothetical protein n=1 Tax=Sorangium sp. So ce834 TaxID=3133321 RepID=UPI003F62BAC6